MNKNGKAEQLKHAVERLFRMQMVNTSNRAMLSIAYSTDHQS